jgi:hypothetical protein
MMFLMKFRSCSAYLFTRQKEVNTNKDKFRFPEGRIYPQLTLDLIYYITLTVIRQWPLPLPSLKTLNLCQAFSKSKKVTLTKLSLIKFVVTGLQPVLRKVGSIEISYS